MSRPFSDADTMFMPELHHTVPMARVAADHRCGWCGIPLAAIPQQPRVYFRPREATASYYHPGCVDAQRRLDALGRLAG